MKTYWRKSYWTVLVLLFGCAHQALSPRPELPRFPASETSVPESHLTNIPAANTCVAEVCGDRMSMPSEEKLQRRFKSTDAYKKTEFAKSVNLAFDRVIAAREVKKARAHELIGQILDPANAGQVAGVQMYVAANRFLDLYFDLMRRRAEELKAERMPIDPSQIFVLEGIDLEKQLTNPDELFLVKSVIQSRMWIPIVNFIFSANFGKFSGFPFPPDAVSEIQKIDYLKSRCVQMQKTLAQKLNYDPQVAANRNYMCTAGAQEIVASDKLRNELAQRFYELQALSLLVDTDYMGDAYSRFKITPELLEQERQKAAGIEMTKPCSDLVGQQWNLSRWPAENKKVVQKYFEKLKGEALNLYSLRESQKSELKDYLEQLTLKFPDDAQAFETQTLRELKNAARVISSSDSEYLSMSLMSKIMVDGFLFSGFDEIREFCQSVRVPPIVDFISDNTHEIHLGTYTMFYPDMGLTVLAHELGHGLSFYLRPQAPPLCKRAADSEGLFAEEDYADHVAGLLLKGPQFRQARNVFCAMDASFKFRPKMRPLPVELAPYPGDSHSFPLVRILNFETARRGVLPESCRSVAEDFKTPVCESPSER